MQHLHRSNVEADGDVTGVAAAEKFFVACSTDVVDGVQVVLARSN